ncbi:DUF1493 family protein, partial [Salmonella enterica subsp. enterica serovar Infantis]
PLPVCMLVESAKAGRCLYS